MNQFEKRFVWRHSSPVSRSADKSSGNGVTNLMSSNKTPTTHRKLASRQCDIGSPSYHDQLNCARIIEHPSRKAPNRAAARRFIVSSHFWAGGQRQSQISIVSATESPVLIDNESIAWTMDMSIVYVVYAKELKLSKL